MTSTSQHDDVDRRDLLSHSVQPSSQLSVSLVSQPKTSKALAKITDLPYGMLLWFSLQSILNTSKSDAINFRLIATEWTQQTI